MSDRPPKPQSHPLQLERHFQNYFELLLQAERERLSAAIANCIPKRKQELMTEIDMRITYLKGAVRIGKLLCLITSEEARGKHGLLVAEREALLDRCAQRFGGFEPSTQASSMSTTVTEARL
jgi:hypothetical protein